MNQDFLETEFHKARQKAEAYITSKYQLNYFDVQDILQNALLKAYLNYSSFNNKCSFVTWYITIAKNEANFFLLKKRKLKEVEDSDDLIKNYSSAWIEPEVYNFSKCVEPEDLIKKALPSLSKEHKQVLSLILKDSLSHKRISSKLKIPINSVRTRIFYAKKKLKKIIKSHELDCQS